MNTTQTSKGEHLISISISITKDDYEPKVNEALKKAQRNANIPGFRPGKAPLSLMKKMYGTSIRLEQLNNIVSEQLNKHIVDNKLDLFGYPLNDPDQKPIDFEKDETLEFCFEAALRPEIKVDLAKTKVDFFHIIADDEEVQKTIDNITEHNPDITHPETVEADDRLELKVCEAENGKEVENGFKKGVYLRMNQVTDKKSKATLTGKETGAEFIFNFTKAMGEEAAAKLLGEDAPIDSDFNIIIDDITREVKPEFNEAFFNRIFPGKDIKDQDTFKAAVKEEMEKQYTVESDRILLQKMIDKLVDTVKFDMPDNFLKRWIVENGQGNVKAEDVEKDYDAHYSKGIRWQLIEDSIVKANTQLVITDEEVKDFIKKQIFPGIDYSTLEDDMKARLDSIAESYRKNDKQIDSVKGQLADLKMTAFLKENMKVTYKDVAFKDFEKELEKADKKEAKAKETKAAKAKETEDKAEK